MMLATGSGLVVRVLELPDALSKAISLPWVSVSEMGCKIQLLHA